MEGGDEVQTNDLGQGAGTHGEGMSGKAPTASWRPQLEASCQSLDV